jgi:hypothetical protein
MRTGESRLRRDERGARGVKSVRERGRIGRGTPRQESTGERNNADGWRPAAPSYSTVTDLARFLGWSTSQPRRTATS